MVGGKGNRSNCKTWILAPRESLCARPVAMDGNDFGKFNTRPAHKQKTRKINLGGWEEAESQAVDFCSAGREPVCPGQWVPGSVAAEAALRVLGAPGCGWWEAAATPLPWAPAWGRGHGGPGKGTQQGQHGRSLRAVGQEQGRRQRRCPPRLPRARCREGGKLPCAVPCGSWKHLAAAVTGVG